MSGHLPLLGKTGIILPGRFLYLLWSSCDRGGENCAGEVVLLGPPGKWGVVTAIFGDEGHLAALTLYYFEVCLMMLLLIDIRSGAEVHNTHSRAPCVRVWVPLA